MPWCPKCREEFRQGFDRCVDCDVGLVGELPPEPTRPMATYISRVTVYQTTQPSEAILVTSLLEGNGTPASIDNQNATQWLIGMPTPAIPLVVSVATPDADDAKSIVSEAIRARPRDAGLPKGTNRRWLIALALLVPAMVDGTTLLGSSAPFAAAGAWAALAAGLILDLRNRRPGSEFSEAKIGFFFLVGALASVGIALTAGPWLLAHSNIRRYSINHAFAIAGPLEEKSKFLPVFLILADRPAWRRDPFAWIIAAAAAGAGFGLVENLGKFQTSRVDTGEALVATCAGLLHPALSGMVGYFVARYATRDVSVMAGLGGLALAALIHGTWDALAFKGFGWI
ncbi:MAG TPA: PrsW family glutamic-type intramembrane protease, partial [Planctomycetota bacterium]|nr:PrsW family glutamic-type intramembrane protease [Planctomycetota bacterium]